MHIALSESLFSRWGKTEEEEDRKPFANVQHFPLGFAYLCQDCNAVGNCASKCPACASEVLMCLAGVLNREVVFEANHVQRQVA
jgi:hypothetical protein